MKHDSDFTRLKIVTERQLGRDLQPDEERVLKALFYFGKGVRLKNQLDNEPVHISKVLPGVMREIDRRRKVVLGRGCLQKYQRRRKSRMRRLEST
jgi:hypothetical protein